MSGGSFDYLYSKLDDEQICKASTVDYLEIMEAFLRKQGKHEPANELLKLKLEIETQINRLKIMGTRLVDVVHDAEWWASYDIGEEEFDKTWAKFIGHSEESIVQLANRARSASPSSDQH